MNVVQVTVMLGAYACYGIKGAIAAGVFMSLASAIREVGEKRRSS